MQTARRIENHHAHAVRLRMLHSRFGNIDRLVLIAHGKHFHTLLLSVDLELFNCRRAIHIAGGQQDFAPFDLILSGQLRRGRRLTCTLKAEHHNYRDLVGRTQFDLGRLAAHQADHLFVHNLDHRLSRSQTFQHIRADRPFLHGFYKLLNDFEAYIRFQKRHFYFF